MLKMHARKITLTGCISYMPGKIAVVEQSREKDTKLRHDCFRAELGWSFGFSGTDQRASRLIFAIHRQHGSVLHRFANKTIRARSASGSVSGNATSTAQRQRTNTRRKTSSRCAIGAQLVCRLFTCPQATQEDGWMDGWMDGTYGHWHIGVPPKGAELFAMGHAKNKETASHPKGRAKGWAEAPISLVSGGCTCTGGQIDSSSIKDKGQSAPSAVWWMSRM